MPFLLMKPSPKKLKLVIFDLDGTLVDAYGAITDSINFMMRQMGYPVQSLRTVKRSVGWGVDSLVGNFVPASKVAQALAIFRAHHDKRLRRNIRLLPGAKTLLPFLKRQGCMLAIASNRPTKFCHIIMKALGIDHYFDLVICGDAVKNPKPSPDMILRILKETVTNPSEAIYVGDMSVDVLCGQRAKVRTIALPTGSCTLAELKAAQPDHLVRRLSDVQKLLKRLF